MKNTNLFCKLSNLKNEATVEMWFVSKLLTHLGFIEEDINLKTSLKEYRIGKGSKSEFYKPDYVVLAHKFPTLVIDAKSPTVTITDWLPQCSSYCLSLNQLYQHNPVEYFILTNGLHTNLYRWDKNEPLLEMEFEDFVQGNPKLIELESYVGQKALKHTATKKRDELMDGRFSMKPIALQDMSPLFWKLHRFIRNTEQMAPSGAFEELMKVVFVKIKKDREIHEKHDVNNLKVKDVVFSVAWIKNQTESENPINDPLFKNLVRDLEKEIAENNKRRIFDPSERINLSASTIERIVEDLEHIDFYASDEDVHGRMFESFLDATVRGKDLGQFFTPRDIVQFMVDLADIQVSKSKVESVFDGCCGSGGFLITAMSNMRRKVDAIRGLSTLERTNLKKKIDNGSLLGIDAGSDPAIHRIARMNMYLHGDGGSNIYFADSINKNIGQVGPSGLEIDKEIEHLRKLLIDDEKKFDVILSNPPFSMPYSRKHTEHRAILDQYEIATKHRQAQSLLSSVMFLERYSDLVDGDGRIFAIIDESILSGGKYDGVREYIRETFIIKAVISLPGDAFRRSAARVKTSVLVLRKKKPGEQQGELFMERAIYLGLNDKTAKRIGITKAELEREKPKEAARIISAYRRFEDGKKVDFIVSSNAITKRLDVKHCLGDTGRRKAAWKKAKFSVKELKAVLSPATGRSVAVDPEETYSLLKVSYGGEVLEAETKFGEECSYAKLNRVAEWDILFSNMGVGRGSIGIVPKYLAGQYVSNEYTILKAKSKEESVFYTNILRSKEILGDLLTAATGMNRGRIRWSEVGKVSVPVYDAKESAKMQRIVKTLESLWHAHQTYQKVRRAEVDAMSSELSLEDEEARSRWLAFKPPE